MRSAAAAACAVFSTFAFAACDPEPTPDMLRGICAKTGRLLSYTDILARIYEGEKQYPPADYDLTRWRRENDVLIAIWPRFDQQQPNERTRPEVLPRLRANGPSRYVIYVNVKYNTPVPNRDRMTFWMDACGEVLAMSTI
jgi:hypothetical protein